MYVDRPQLVFQSATTVQSVRISTIVIVLGIALFVLPIPGTFILGGLLIFGGAIARLLGA